MTEPDKHNAQTDMMTGRNRRTAVGAAGLAALMIGAAYAAVPLYDLFCRVTGYGGTTQVATAAPASAATREITIRFDASLNRDMPWSFEAPAQPVQLAIGEQGLAFYEAHNPTAPALPALRPIMCRRQRPAFTSQRSTVFVSPSRFWRRASAWICR